MGRVLPAVAVFILIVAVATTPALAQRGGNGHNCQGVAGTYTRPSQTDVGNGPIDLMYLLQLHEGGTAYQYWTGLPEQMSTIGTGSPDIGSWSCRNGEVIVVLIRAVFTPFPTVDPFTGNPEVDVSLYSHVRATYRMNVVNGNTLERIEAVGRSYTPTQDPTDANGGTLGTVDTTHLTYTRLVATDADLAP